MKDQGGAEKLIWLDRRARSAARAAGSQWTDDGDLTRRVDELEQKVAAILADLIPEASPPPSPERDRRSLADEIAELRKVREDIQEGLANLGRGGPELRSNEVRAEPASDVHSAIAGEMRALLAELFADFRARAAPLLAEQPDIKGATAPVAAQPTVEDVETTPAALGAATIDEPSTGTKPPAQPSAIATPPVLVGPTVEDVESVPAPVDSVRVAESLTESVESVIEHVDELVRRSANGPVADEYVEDVRAAEEMAPTDALDRTAAASEPLAPIFDDYIEELPPTETVAPTDAVEVETPPAEPAPPIVDERIFEPLEPESIVQEDVEELVRPESPPSLDALEPTAAPTESFEAIAPEYVEDVDSLGPLPHQRPLPPLGIVEPIAPEYAAPAQPIIDIPIAPPLVPSTPDPRIDALWDSASLPTEAEAAPLSQLEAASFITEEVVPETRPLEIPEAPSEPLPEFAPEQTIEFAPPPPVEYAPEPPAESEPAPAAYSQPLAEADTPSWASPFPELRVADDRGLHQIQIVISPIHSFPRLLDTQARIRALSTVNAVHLRDFRNGIATFAVAVSEAISPAEFGAVIQMLDDLHLRLEGTTQTSVELRAEDEPPTS